MTDTLTTLTFDVLTGSYALDIFEDTAHTIKINRNQLANLAAGLAISLKSNSFNIIQGYVSMIAIEQRSHAAMTTGERKEYCWLLLCDESGKPLQTVKALWDKAKRDNHMMQVRAYEKILALVYNDFRKDPSELNFTCLHAAMAHYQTLYNTLP